MTRRVLELGSYIVPAYAGMVLAEQGLRVEKWVSPTTLDPVLGLRHGADLWAWLNNRKWTREHHATHIVDVQPGTYDIVLDNIRAGTWRSWGVDPEEQADRLGVVWVSMRDEFDGRSFDAVAQARAWGDHVGYLPFYIGDTAGGLWLAFKALAAGPGHHIVRQATCLAKLVEGELMVTADRADPHAPPWDEPGTYGQIDASHVAVEFRDDRVVEPFRDAAWRRQHLRHHGGRLVI